MNARQAGLLIVAATLLLGGCSDRKLRPLNPCTVTGVVRKVSGGGSENVDLLFMVDNSGSMAAEQAALTRELPNIARVLLTGDLDGDMVEDFPPVQSLRVGVISSDMGVLGVGVIDSPVTNTTSTARPSCGSGPPVDATKASFGDDGVIQLSTAETPLPAGCLATYPTFLEYPSNEFATQEDFVQGVGCTAVLGTGGCGLEMQLEAILTAVTDSSRSGAPSFAPSGRTGQAGPGGANEGFFRDGSVIGIIAVSDEEDCSTAEPGVFMVPAETDIDDAISTSVNTHCTDLSQYLYSIERYVDGLRALRPDAPDRIVFAGIIGMPLSGENLTFGELLNDPAMQYQNTVSPQNDEPFLEPACFRCTSSGSATGYATCPDDDDPGTVDVDESTTPQNESFQWAAPGRRYAELASQLELQGMNAVLRSICTDDFAPAVQQILERIGQVLKGACLPRALNPDATGRVNCDVVEILPAGSTCADRTAAGREATPIRTEQDASGRTVEVCRITQYVPTDADRNGGNPPAGTGWFYDNYTQENIDQGCEQRVGFTNSDALPLAGSTIRLECLQPVQGGGLEGADIFQPCAVNTDCHFTSVAEAEEFIFRYNLDLDEFVSGGALTGQEAMACDLSTRTCQITCGDASDCPGGFVCDKSFCVNPTCSLTGSAATAPVESVDGGL